MKCDCLIKVLYQNVLHSIQSIRIIVIKVREQGISPTPADILVNICQCRWPPLFLYSIPIDCKVFLKCLFVCMYFITFSSLWMKSSVKIIPAINPAITENMKCSIIKARTLTTVFLELLTVGNFHEQNFRVKNFSPIVSKDEIFLTTNYLA